MVTHDLFCAETFLCVAHYEAEYARFSAPPLKVSRAEHSVLVDQTSNLDSEGNSWQGYFDQEDLVPLAVDNAAKIIRIEKTSADIRAIRCGQPARGLVIWHFFSVPPGSHRPSHWQQQVEPSRSRRRFWSSDNSFHKKPAQVCLSDSNRAVLVKCNSRLRFSGKRSFLFLRSSGPELQDAMLEQSRSSYLVHFWKDFLVRRPEQTLRTG